MARLFSFLAIEYGCSYRSFYTLLFRPFPWSFPCVACHLWLNMITLLWSIEPQKSTTIICPKAMTFNFGMNPRAASATRALLRLTLCH